MPSSKKLPDTQAMFFKLVKLCFPVLYDIKHFMKFCNSLHGGLNKLAEQLEGLVSVTKKVLIVCLLVVLL